MRETVKVNKSEVQAVETIEYVWDCPNCRKHNYSDEIKFIDGFSCTRCGITFELVEDE